MAKKRFYAVKNGRVPGVYPTWDEAKAQVDGFSGAVYKGFTTEVEARTYMNNDTDQVPDAANENFNDAVLPENGAYAFVDGSYNPATACYGYGGFIVVNGVEHVLSGSGVDEAMASMRNVAGEISGAMAAVTKAYALGVKHLTLFYDYQGIEAWARGQWKATKPETRTYITVMHEAELHMTIDFVHTPGHTGIPGNERADALAKRSVGL